MRKIRTFVAHDDEQIKNSIINIIEKFDYVEVVGTASNGIEAYKKIIECQPEMVFAKYTMDGLEVIKKSKENLEEVPVFNMISNSSISEEKIKEMYNLLGNNLNSIVSEPVSNNEINNIITTYKEYIDEK